MFYSCLFLDWQIVGISTCTGNARNSKCMQKIKNNCLGLYTVPSGKLT
jgi:uncharacterized metal-binding protein